MIVKVKICGVRSIKAAKAAIETGADFLGFNFVPTSKRFIKPLLAAEIINQIRGKVYIVGVFQNETLELVNTITRQLGLDFVQLHGQETINYCQQIRRKIIKAFSLAAETSINKLEGTISRYSDSLYPGSLYLIDRKIQGSGKMVDLKKAVNLATRYQIFFAGGLNPDNVADVISRVHPFAVDVAGGVETNDYQDLGKIKLFVKNAKRVIL